MLKLLVALGCWLSIGYGAKFWLVDDFDATTLVPFLPVVILVGIHTGNLSAKIVGKWLSLASLGFILFNIIVMPKETSLSWGQVGGGLIFFLIGLGVFDFSVPFFRKNLKQDVIETESIFSLWLRAKRIELKKRIGEHDR